MRDKNPHAGFEAAVLPHLDAAYNLARWLTRSEQDAEDVVQDACLRALRAFGGFRGADGKAWLLAIVRNCAYSWLQRSRSRPATTPLDDDLYDPPSDAPGPEAVALARADRQRVTQAMEELPAEFREVLVLRELEGLSYKEIARVADVPIGTVMSRLARARTRLARRLGGSEATELEREV